MEELDKLEPFVPCGYWVNPKRTGQLEQKQHVNVVGRNEV